MKTSSTSSKSQLSKATDEEVDVEIGGESDSNSVKFLIKPKIENSAKSKNKKLAKFFSKSRNIGAVGEPNSLTLETKKAFNYRRQAFTEAPIFRHLETDRIHCLA